MKELNDSGFLADFPIQKIKSDEDGLIVDLDQISDQLSSLAFELRQVLTDQNDSLGVGAGIKFGRGPSAIKSQNQRVGFADALQQRNAKANAARELYAQRRRRAALFGNLELFGEPAWDILLDLYIADVENRPVSVSSACIGSASSPTTGLRWLGVLAENDLILREHDPDDQRRVLVRLTERSVAAMDQYFRTAN